MTAIAKKYKDDIKQLEESTAGLLAQNDTLCMEIAMLKRPETAKSI